MRRLIKIVLVDEYVETKEVAKSLVDTVLKIVHEEVHQNPDMIFLN